MGRHVIDRFDGHCIYCRESRRLLVETGAIESPCPGAPESREERDQRIWRAVEAACGRTVQGGTKRA